jgi:hypothetical protein
MSETTYHIFQVGQAYKVRITRLGNFIQEADGFSSYLDAASWVAQAERLGAVQRGAGIMDRKKGDHLDYDVLAQECGAAIMKAAEENPALRAKIMKVLDLRLTSPSERALFDLPPRSNVIVFPAPPETK